MTEEEEETTKFAKGAKRDAKIVFKHERYKQGNNSDR
jgi:hypothetical protein